MNIWNTSGGYRIIQVLSGRSNVFLLTNNVLNILVDTSPKGKREKLENRLDKLKVRQIDYLILTHTHFDHAGNAAFIKNKYHAKVIVHVNEFDYLKMGDSPLPKGSVFLTKALIKLVNKLNVKILYEPCIADIPVKEFYSFYNNGFNAYIIHTPGHSAGSLSIIVDDEIAVVGDTMFGVFRNTVFPPFSDDIEQMIRSWKLLLDTACSLFIPTHGFSKDRLLLLKDYEKRIPQ